MREIPKKKIHAHLTCDLTQIPRTSRVHPTRISRAFCVHPHANPCASRDIPAVCTQIPTAPCVRSLVPCLCVAGPANEPSHRCCLAGAHKLTHPHAERGNTIAVIILVQRKFTLRSSPLPPAAPPTLPAATLPASSCQPRSAIFCRRLVAAHNLRTRHSRWSRRARQSSRVNSCRPGAGTWGGGVEVASNKAQSARTTVDERTHAQA